VHYNRNCPAALAALAILTACTQQNAPSEPAGGASSEIEISNASPVSVADPHGGQIFLEIFPFGDAESGLAVALGSADAFPICGQSFEEVLLWDILFIGSRPDPEVNDPFLGGRLIQALANGEIFATVYEWNGEELGCDLVLNAQVVAHGTVHALLTDNDFNAFLRPEPIRADAFGVSVHGTVTLASGETARLNAVYRAVFFPPDVVKETSNIKLLTRE
jgi:hypothetical protein